MSEFSDSDDGFDEAFRNLSEDNLTYSAALRENVSSDKKYTIYSMDDHCENKRESHISNVTPKEKRITDLKPDSLSFVHKNETSISRDFSVLSHKNGNQNTPTYRNTRFVPGSTPKVMKRKFPGPAGILLESDNLKPFENSDVSLHPPKLPAFDFENVVSSQYSVEHLSLLSWQKLQADVSSHPHLLSTAEYYSICQVLKESSKKRMPKYLVVPVLCVLIKSISYNGTTSKPVFMDDTGEINGKISEDVFAKYEKYMLEGTALILKDVTFLCNLLMLKSTNIVSLYLSDGTVNHVQNLEHNVNDKESLKSTGSKLIMNLQNSEKKNGICADVEENVSFSNGRSIKKPILINHESNTEHMSVSFCAKPDTSKGIKPISKMPSYFENYKTDCSTFEDTLSDDNFMDGKAKLLFFMRDLNSGILVLLDFQEYDFTDR